MRVSKEEFVKRYIEKMKPIIIKEEEWMTNELALKKAEETYAQDYDFLTKELGFGIFDVEKLRQRIKDLEKELKKQPYPPTNLDSLILQLTIGMEFLNKILDELLEEETEET